MTPRRLASGWLVGGACGLRLQAAARRVWYCHGDGGSRLFRRVGNSVTVHGVPFQKTRMFGNMNARAVFPLPHSRVERACVLGMFNKHEV